MTYIGTAKDTGCFMCDICKSRDDEAHLVIKRGKKCVLVMNRYPYNGGHLMVAPKRHVATLKDMNSAEQLEMMQMTAEATELLRKVSRPDGCNIGVNLGEAAGAGLKDHIHMHIVPRWSGDTNFMPVFADIKIIPQALEELGDLLRKAAKKTREA